MKLGHSGVERLIQFDLESSLFCLVRRNRREVPRYGQFRTQYRHFIVQIIFDCTAGDLSCTLGSGRCISRQLPTESIVASFIGFDVLRTGFGDLLRLTDGRGGRRQQEQTIREVTALRRQQMMLVRMRANRLRVHLSHATDRVFDTRLAEGSQKTQLIVDELAVVVDGLPLGLRS
ncbi:MAG: hypothetical protein WBD41_01400 [Rhodococcus sp. (in: high G+C Gram-positive bacteria)]